MWWFLQIAGCILLSIALAMIKQYGLTWHTYLLYALVNIAFTGWMFPIAYKLAPSFIQPWMLGTGTLIILGILWSMFYFNEYVTWSVYTGIGLIMMGCLLIVK